MGFCHGHIRGPACNSIVGKNSQQAWWVGICGTTLRSYLKGASSLHDGGTLDGNWNHIAVTFDGSNRRHYINGEMVGIFTETGTLTTSTSPVRIGSDSASPFTPTGAIDEVRLWNVARTTEQIQSTINVPIATAMPGLVSVWSLDASGNDAVGPHHGSVNGSVGFLNSPVAPGCSATATSLCFEGRFAVNVSWTSPDGSTGVGHVVPGASANSGLFWFFNSDNWELLVKEINGCSLDNRRWIFSAATTNVSYRLNVLDITHGVNKIYFNYPGPPAPAVTDTDAFATCP